MTSQGSSSGGVFPATTDSTSHAEPQGHEVSCRIFEVLFLLMDHEGISVKDWLTNTPYTRSYLEDSSHDIAWDACVALLERLEQLLAPSGFISSLTRTSRQLNELKSLGVMRTLVRVVAPLPFLYTVLARWFGPTCFTNVRFLLESRSDAELSVDLTIEDGYRHSDAFFRFCAALLASAPALMGCPTAHVTVDAANGRASYAVALPPSRTIWSRTKRAWRAFFAPTKVLGELTAQHDKLLESQEELRHTRQRLAEHHSKLERSESELRQLLERSADAVVVLRHDEVIYANEAMASFLGYPRASALWGLARANFLRLPDPEDQTPSPQGTDGEITPPPDEVTFIRHDGEEVAGEVRHFRALFDGEESDVFISRDVTGRRELAAHIMQMDRMIAVGTLAGGVAHELNNPLTYVFNNIDYSFEVLNEARTRIEEARSEGQDAPVEHMLETLNNIEEALADSLNGGQRMREIVRDLQTFSRRRGEESWRVEAAEALDTAIKMAWHKMQYRAKLVRDYRSSALIAADPANLGQVLLNLLINAAQAIPAGEKQQNTIWVRSRDLPDHVLLEIEDTGEGIRPEHLEVIFDPFFTTRTMNEGTGLGLYICRNLIEKMHGTLEVESTPGDGTTIRVKLPRATKPETQRSERTPHRAPSRVIGADSEEPRVLLIDDDPMIGASVARLLSNSCNITFVNSAGEALELLERGQQFDFVICDVVMPEVTGIDLYRKLGANRPELCQRFLLITGEPQDDADRRLLNELEVPLLGKPFSRQMLVEAMHALMHPAEES